MAEPSIRESLLAAQQQVQRPEAAPETPTETPEVEAVQEVAPEHAPESPDEAVQETPAERQQRARDEAGRFTKAEQAANAQKSAAAKTALTSGAPAATAPDDGPKPPASWKPAVREHWGKLPPEVRQEVARREREVATVLQQTAEHRKTAEVLERTLQPYRGLIPGDPMQEVSSLLQTSATLRTGTQQQKASIVGAIIKGFGVDIDALAAALDGKASAQQPNASQQAQEFRDPRFDQFMGHLQQVQAQRLQQTRAEAAQQLESFAASHEFLDDVRGMMANMMAAARQEGNELSLDEAYEAACLATPSVRGLFQQRQNAQNAAKAAASAQRSRQAASSIRHEPTAPASGAQSASLRDTINAAAASLSRR